MEANAINPSRFIRPFIKYFKLFSSFPVPPSFVCRHPVCLFLEGVLATSREKGRKLAQQYTKFVQSLMAYWGLRFAAKVVSVRVRCLAIILRMPQRLFFLSYRILAPFSFSLLFNANCLSVSSILCNFALA